MGTDVAAFAKQLKEDGIEAARQEATKILGEARAASAQMLEEAKRAVSKLRADGEAEVDRHRQRSEAEMKLVARDLILGVKQQIEAIGARLLREKVKDALATSDVVQKALTDLLKTQGSGQTWELALGKTTGKPLAQAVLSDLFKAQGAQVALTTGLKQAGFELQSTAGTEVLEVTEESVTDAFRRLMSSELRALLDPTPAVAPAKHPTKKG